MPVKAVASLYLAVSLLAFTGVFAKVLPADALTITQLRSVVACMSLALFLTACGQSLKLQSRQEYIGVWLLGVLVGAHWATFFHAMQVSTIAVGILSFYCYPVVSTLLEPLFSRRLLSARDLASAVLLMLGLAILVSDKSASRGAFSQVWQLGQYAEGVFWGIGSAILMSVRNLIQKYHFHRVAASKLMFHQIVAICVVALPFIDVSAVSGFSPSTWGLLVILGVFATALGHTLIVFSLKSLSAASVAMISCAQPALAILLGWVFVSEVPTLQMLFGGGLIILVALYETWRAAKRVAPTATRLSE